MVFNKLANINSLKCLLLTGGLAKLGLDKLSFNILLSRPEIG